MKFTTTVSVLAMAITAFAAPSDIDARGGHGGGGSCNSNQAQVCCNGVLNCVVQVLGSSCTGGAYCCKTSAPVGTLVNVAILNCVSL